MCCAPSVVRWHTVWVPARGNSDHLEHLVREFTERILHVLGDNRIVGGGCDAVRAPHTSIGVVVDKMEVTRLRVNLDRLDAHGRFHRGERVITLGSDTRGAVRAGVAKIALAALNLLCVPELV